MNALRFENQVAIVTGAGAGLGRSYAMLLAARGAQVVVNDVGATAHAVVEDIRSAGGTAIASLRAVGSREAGEAIVSDAMAAFGRVDILVNNAGVVRDKAFHKMEEADAALVLEIHLNGSFYTSQAAFRQMRDQGGGRIVNTTSTAGIYGNFGQANYSAAKAGLIGLTRTIAVEGARSNVKANLICPGARTPMTEALVPDSVILPPEWVAPGVCWLCHPECDWTGEILVAEGGRFARVFVAETRGVFLQDPTIEDVAAAADKIRSTEGYSIFADLHEHSAFRTRLRQETASY